MAIDNIHGQTTVRHRHDVGTTPDTTVRPGADPRTVRDGYDTRGVRRGFEASPAERLHYLAMLLEAGFDEPLGRTTSDAMAQALWASTMSPAGKDGYQLPFFDPEQRALGEQMLAQFFGALGVPEPLARAAASFFADMVAPERFYQPFFEGLGGTGPVDLDRLLQLARGQGLEHSDGLRRQRAQGNTLIRPGARRRNVDELLDRALRGATERRRGAGPRPRFDVQARRLATRRSSPGADLLRHRVDRSPQVDRVRATRDAARIREAVEGWGTDEEALIGVLSNRSNAEIREIARAYQQVYGESLEERIESETSGDLRTSLLSMLRGDRSETSAVDPVKVSRDVVRIREAVDGWGTDEEALVDVLTNRSTAEIQAIQTAYQETYVESLRERIDGETSGDLRTTLLAQLDRRDGTERTAHTQPGRDPVRADATRTAAAIREAVEGAGTDEETLIRSLRGKTNEEIREIRRAYREMYGESLEERIDSETSGDFATALRSILSGQRSDAVVADPVRASRDAAAIREAVEGWGTDEETLTRIVSGRSPAEIRAISAAYQQMYGESLRSRVSDETSGDYRRTLLALIDGE